MTSLRSFLLIFSLQKKEKKEEAKRQYQKTDVNVFKLDLSTVAKDSEVMTGDPTFCMKCAVTVSHLSKITHMKTSELKATNAALFNKNQAPAYCGVRDLFFPPEEVTAAGAPSSSSSASTTADTQQYDDLPEEVDVWVCEFCGFHNISNVAEEELPKSDTVDYVINPAPVGAVEEQNIIFCVDISGSMCVTTEVQGATGLKIGNEARDTFARTHGAEGDQRLPGEKRNVKYVSRLQCVQAAIEQHITQIAKTNPNYKIGLVTFSDEVTIIGDGTQEPLVVAGDKLDSFHDLKEIGEKYSINKNIKEAEKDLLKKLWSLQENGCTSLGPALLLSILIAGSKPASKVILCTDGLANSV